MHNHWLQHLRCPRTKAPLELQDAQIADGRVASGRLVAATGEGYPVVGGIPRFTAQPPDRDAATTSATEQTNRSFGDIWRSEAHARFGQAKHERRELETQFLNILGQDSLDDVRSLFADGANVLNAGCGMGWSEHLFNLNPACNRFAVDISLSVEVAHARALPHDNIFVAQADLLALPFPEEHFDVIFSGGVIHHTGDAKRSFEELCRHLKPGGHIGIYVYNVKPPLREMADAHIRKRTTAMDFDQCREFSEQMAALGKALQRFDRPLSIDRDIPLLGIRKGDYSLQKFIYDHFVKCFYNAAMGTELSVLNNMDWYLPGHASHHTREEVDGWFSNCGICDVRHMTPPGWEHSGFFVSGTKRSGE